MTNQSLLGVDLGGTKIEALLIAPDGSETDRRRLPTPVDDYKGTLRAIDKICREIEDTAGISSPLPLGIGTPGAISPATGLMKNCNSTCLNDKPFAADLETLSGRPVRIANDADCMALSEATDGAGAGAHAVFGVILGTGVGGGIVIDGKLARGTNAIAGEWGHNPLPLNALASEMPVPTRRACYCGRKDCVETWLSGPGFSRTHAEATGATLTPAEIVSSARDGDGKAALILENYVELLALALATVINVLDPAVIVLAGGVSNIDELYDGVKARLPVYVFSDRVDTMLEPAKYGDSSGVRGAAWLWR